MIAGRDHDQADRCVPTGGEVLDIVAVGPGRIPALVALCSLGLRVGGPIGAVAAGSVVAGLRHPAVVVIAPAARRIVPRLAGLRRERPALRTVLLSDDPDLAPPSGIDEQLPADAPDDVIMGRIVVHLAHARASAPRRLPVADETILDLDARALRQRGRLIHLRPLECRLLEELARSPGRPLTREWLVTRAWTTPPPQGSRTVDVHVRWLRQKLEPDPRRPIHLLTVRGFGYRLDPEPDAPAAAVEVATLEGRRSVNEPFTSQEGDVDLSHPR